jgi:hypothetical protein
MAHEKGEYEETAVMQFFVSDVLPEADIPALTQEVLSLGEEHLIPQAFQQVMASSSNHDNI